MLEQDASTSAGATFSPPVTIVSTLRPMTTGAALVEAAEIARAQRPASPRPSGPRRRSPRHGDPDASPGQRHAGSRDVVGSAIVTCEHAWVSP
jgi:hypothetical protein